MIGLSDFNYAYVAGRLLDGANGMGRENVISDIRSISGFLGNSPVDKMLRSIPDHLEKESKVPFRTLCSGIRGILIKDLEPKDYDLATMFEYDRLHNEDE